MIDAAVQIRSGLTQPGRPAPGVGLYKLHRRSVDILHDRRKYWLAISTWNASMVEQVHKLMIHDPEVIIDIGYSYGIGHGHMEFAHEVARYGRSVDLACYIDGVPRHRFLPRKLGSLWSHHRISVPRNVKRVAVWWTLNRSSIWQPQGRDVATGPDTVVIRRTCYGAQELLVDYGPPGIRRIDPNMFHSNIDDDDTIHDEIIEIMSHLLELPNAA